MFVSKLKFTTMKKDIFTIFAFAIIALFTTSCDPNQPEEIDYNKLVVNTWRLSTINDSYIASDKMIIYNIDADGTMLRALGSANGGWMECPDFHYTVNTHYLTLEGTDPQNNEWTIELDITKISSKSMSFAVRSIKKNGMLQTVNNNVYTFIKNEDKGYASQLVGTWQCKETTANVGETPLFFVEIKSDGTYTYYDYNSANDTWTPSFTTQYFIYGEVLTHNYLNTYHCWIVYRNDVNKFVLKSNAENGNLVEYTFQRVDGIPQ